MLRCVTVHLDNHIVLQNAILAETNVLHNSSYSPVPIAVENSQKKAEIPNGDTGRSRYYDCRRPRSFIEDIFSLERTVSGYEDLFEALVAGEVPASQPIEVRET